MIRKDFIEAEIQKLNQIISRILSLKNDGNLDEALELSEQTLAENFGLDKEFLQKAPVEDFEAEIKTRSFTVDKLNLLVQLLFESEYPFQETEECLAVMHKTAFILTFLETEHHQQSFENLSRREMIDNFLNNRQYE